MPRRGVGPADRPKWLRASRDGLRAMATGSDRALGVPLRTPPGPPPVVPPRRLRSPTCPPRALGRPPPPSACVLPCRPRRPSPGDRAAPAGPGEPGPGCAPPHLAAPWAGTAEGRNLIAEQVRALQADPPPRAPPAEQLCGQHGARPGCGPTPLRRAGDVLTCERSVQAATVHRAQVIDVLRTRAPNHATKFPTRRAGPRLRFVDRREGLDVSTTQAVSAARFG